MSGVVYVGADLDKIEETEDYVVFDSMTHEESKTPIHERVGWHLSIPIEIWESLGKPGEMRVMVAKP